MTSFRLIHSRQFPIDRYRETLEREDIGSIAVDSLNSLGGDGSLDVVLLDPALDQGPGSHSNGRAVTLGVGLSRDTSADDAVFLNLPGDPSPSALFSAVRRAFQYLHEKNRSVQLEAQLAQTNRELDEMNKIGIALSAERDHDVLLEMILTQARMLSRSDAGSLYLIEEVPEQGKILRWKLAQNDSIDVDFEERILQITKKSLAGYVALTGETLVIDDAYTLPASVEYSINQSFDRENGYLTRSIVVLPMTNHEGDAIGVLQLINRKRAGAPARLTAELVPDHVIPFDEHTIKLMRSLAAQAAISLENNILYDSIERLFEGFVTASVKAIEQRDPTTSGHSFRVADLTVELAKTLDQISSGQFKDVTFTLDQIRELRYASLLHDFGKVGVREKILVKEKKLYPQQLDVIRSRFDYVMKSVESGYHKKKLDFLIAHGIDSFAKFSQQLDAELKEELGRLEGELSFIVKSNEPTVLPEGEFVQLQQLARREFDDILGKRRKLLEPDEVRVLSIRKGSLDATERTEIESHVTHTFDFLSKIPWTKDLRTVPNIAYAHHEKLNGRGYPRGLGAEQIPVQSRMMTISDIFDALTATDRPYKRAVPLDRAIDILRMEVKDGLLDSALVDVFVDAKIFEKTATRAR